MSYFGRLAEQAGLSVAGSAVGDPFVAATLAPDSAAFASPPEAAPDMPEIDEVIVVAAPSPPATVPAATRPDRKPLSSPERKAANVAESPPPAPAAPQPQALAIDNDPVAPPPAAAAAPAGLRPTPDPIQAEPSLLRQALKWVASDPALALEPARVPSPEGANQDLIDTSTRLTESAAQAPRVAASQNGPVARVAPARPPIPEADLERASAQAATPIPVPPATNTLPPADTPAPRASRTPFESRVEEVVQVSIGNIHVRVEAPAPGAMPELPPAAPRAAVAARPSQAPSARLRRRYLHL